MKKIFVIMGIALLTMGLSSCLNSNDSKGGKKSNLTALMYNRIVGTDHTAQFSTAKYGLSIDFDAGTIIATPKVKLATGAVSFQTSAMKLKYNESIKAYTFEGGSTTTTDNHRIENIEGTLDLQSSVLYMQFKLDGKQVYASTGLLFFKDKTTTISRPIDGAQERVVENQSSYGFKIDAQTLKGTVSISDFDIDNTTPGQDRNEIMTYAGLEVKVTDKGYEFTGTNLAPSVYGNKYTANNFTATISGQGQLLTASYDCNGRHVTITGKMFGSK